MSEEFTLKEGPARYQIDEIIGLSGAYSVNDTYWDYDAMRVGNRLSIWLPREGFHSKEEPRRVPDSGYDDPNIEKIARSVGIPSESWDFGFDDVDAHINLKIAELEWEEYPGHEEFAHDLYKLRNRLEKVDEYLQHVEKEGNRIANELSRGL